MCASIATAVAAMSCSACWRVVSAFRAQSEQYHSGWREIAQQSDGISQVVAAVTLNSFRGWADGAGVADGATDLEHAWSHAWAQISHPSLGLLAAMVALSKRLMDHLPFSVPLHEALSAWLHLEPMTGNKPALMRRSSQCSPPMMCFHGLLLATGPKLQKQQAMRQAMRHKSGDGLRRSGLRRCCSFL